MAVLNACTAPPPTSDTILLSDVASVKTPLLENILAQPKTLEGVLAYQTGEGRAALQRCAVLMRNTRRAVFTGMGASLFACGPMRFALAANGINVQVLETAELLYSYRGLLDRETLLVLVSRSGESVETLRLLEKLPCKTVGVTNVRDSALARTAQDCIILNSPNDQLVAIQTYAATVLTLLMLAAHCTDTIEETEQDVRSTLALLPDWIAENIAADAEWKTFIHSASYLYVLGRGPSLPSAEEGCLLMHEVSKVPSAGMSVAQFRHGFVEAADAGVRAVVLGTYQDTVPIDAQFALDLQRMGAAVRWIGPEISNLTTLSEWPDGVPARCNALVEIVPLQMLAYRSAEARAIVPGTFRWASTVTSSESGFPGLEAGNPSTANAHGQSVTG